MRPEHDSPTRRYDGADIERWEVDPVRSSLTFSLRHIVLQQIRGRFDRWGGTMFVAPKEPWLSSVEIWVDLGSIRTGASERDAHLCSAEFLDVGRFPSARFHSTDVRLEQALIIVEGALDLHGIVRDVELRANIGATTTGPDGRERVRYTARGTLDRQSYGLHWNQDLDAGGVVVGDVVDLVGDVEVVRAGVKSEASSGS